MIIINDKIGISLLKECVMETEVFICNGNDVGVKGFEVKNGQNECASVCALTEECLAWTFLVSASRCWLKSDDSCKGNADGWITGTKECGKRGTCEL